MTVNEYMAHTNIKSVEEAQEYLTTLRILFIVVAIAMVGVRGLAELNEQFEFLYLPYLILLIFFVFYCVKVVKAEKISRAHAGFSILFAPLSWIWFYPEITEPLKIITGKLLPPSSLPSREKEKQQYQERNKKFWRRFVYIVIIVLVLIGGSLVAAYFLEPEKKSATGLENSPITIENEYSFTSEDGSFTMKFPTKPSYELSANVLQDVGNVKTITYSSKIDDKEYLLNVFEYEDTRINENSKYFDVDRALEGALEAMLNSRNDTVLFLKEEGMISGKKALQYQIKIGQERLDGFLFFKENRLFSIAINYPISSTENLTIDRFIDSFKFNN
jgi:hypothetical protein